MNLENCKPPIDQGLKEFRTIKAGLPPNKKYLLMRQPLLPDLYNFDVCTYLRKQKFIAFLSEL